MRDKSRLLGFLLAIAASSARAVVPLPADSAWAPADVSGAFAPESPAAIDYLTFGNQFQNQGTDQWCDQIPITFPIGQDTVEELGRVELFNGGTFNGNRQFRRYPNGAVAVVDQLEIKVDLGASLGWIASQIPGGDTAVGFFFGASLDNQSFVSRPTHSSDSCKQLKRFFNPLDFKTVLPLNAKRLSRMDVGEIWMIPMTFRIGLEPLDAGSAPPPTGAFRRAPSAFYLALEASKASDPTVTVYRAGPKEIRLKLHLDQVKAFGAQAGMVAGPIPATDIGTPGAAAVLARVFPNRISTSLLLFSRQIDSVLGVQLGVSGSRSSGQQVLLQYTLDPTNPEQMEHLAKVIRGDLSVLKALKGFVTPRAGDASSPDMRRQLDALTERHRAALGLAADIAGIDDYHAQVRSRNFSIPVVMSHSGGTTWRQDHYIAEAPQEHDVRSYKVQTVSSLGFVSFPLFGSFFDKSHASATQVLTDDSDAAGVRRGRPYLVYTREWGLLRARRAAVQKVVGEADALLGSVGSDSAPDARTRLPEELRSVVQEGRYHKGYLDMSLVLGPEAVDKMLSASVQSVIRAFAGTLTGDRRALFDYVLSVARIAGDGSIAFERRMLESFAPYARASDEDRSYMAYLARSLCRKATQLVWDLADLRSDSLSPALRAQALFALASGKGGVSRDDFLKIAMRLVSPEDVSGDVMLHLDVKKTDAANYTVRYILNPAKFADPALRAMSAVQRGFVAPTPDAPLND